MQKNDEKVYQILKNNMTMQYFTLKLFPEFCQKNYNVLGTFINHVDCGQHGRGRGFIKNPYY